MKQINVGMVGYKFMGKAHSAAYRAIPMFFPQAVKPVLLRGDRALRSKKLFRDGDGSYGRDAQIVRRAPQPDSGFDARVSLRLPQHRPRLADDIHVCGRLILRARYF